jgi:hypothetical protein
VALLGAPGTRRAKAFGHSSHAHQFNRARRELKFLRIRLGRVFLDISRKIAEKETLGQRLADILALAVRVRRATPVITSTFEIGSDIGVCPGLYLSPPAEAGVSSKRGAVHRTSVT